MAGPPAPLAAVQAAVMKSAAGQMSQVDPGLSTQANAVRSDLSVMADQAKGYTAGVNAGTIEAENQRAAQGRRLAIEKSQADAERARDDQLAQIETQRAQMGLESQRQRAGQDTIRAREDYFAGREAAADEPDLDAVAAVKNHMLVNTSQGFGMAAEEILSSGVLDAKSAIAVLARRKVEEPEAYENVNTETFRKYAEAVFAAQQGQAVNLRTIKPSRPKRHSQPAAAAKKPESKGFRPPFSLRNTGQHPLDVRI